MASHHKIQGEVAYLFAFDLAYDAVMSKLARATLLGQPMTSFGAELGRRAPRQAFFYRPQMVTLPPIELTTPAGPVSVARTVKVFPVGAVSIVFRVPFAVQSLIELAPWHEATFKDVRLHHEATRLAEQAASELRNALLRPTFPIRDEEAYTVFCVHSDTIARKTADGRHVPDVETFLNHGRREVASLLMQESDQETLSEQEVLDTTNRYLAYGKDDLTVIDWDAALLVDQPGRFDSTLHIMELANVQLAELEEYDRILDEALSAGYRDVQLERFYRRGRVLDNLRELRLDVTRLSDELSNTTKFFGDWHMARVYQALSDRFHLSDWHKAIDEKLATLDGLYQILRQDQVNRWLIGLEVAVVVLFIIEVVKALA